MKHKVSELDGPLLDAAVALANGWTIEGGHICIRGRPIFATRVYTPTKTWDMGGPIIEREHITVAWEDGEWLAIWPVDESTIAGAVLACVNTQAGPTALIAAMRAYVASKLGDEVEL
jgi:hypothetical protein